MTHSRSRPTSASGEATLRRAFRVALDDLYGDRLDRAILFGSRARGDADEESDYDIAVFLDPAPDFWVEMKRLADLSVDLFDVSGVLVNAIPFAARAYEDRTPILFEIRRDGLDL